MFKFLVSVAAGYAGARAIEAKVQRVPVMLTLKHPFTSVAKIKAVRDALPPLPPAAPTVSAPALPAVSSTAGGYLGDDPNSRLVAAWWTQRQRQQQQQAVTQKTAERPAPRRMVRRGVAPWRFPNSPMRN